MGEYTWTTNEYNGFIIWYIFVSGQVVQDERRTEDEAGPLSYFESGASNGIHASQTYTMGEQLWGGRAFSPKFPTGVDHAKR
jgi:hypothetical protein